MSWDSYIDNLIAQTKDSSGTAHADRACIIGLDGGAKWTTDGHPNALKLQSEEGAITLQASKTAIVIAHCREGYQQGNINKGVAVIAEYLESLGM